MSSERSTGLSSWERDEGREGGGDGDDEEEDRTSESSLLFIIKIKTIINAIDINTITADRVKLFFEYWCE